MPEAYICDYVRTPIGRYGGALASVIGAAWTLAIAEIGMLLAVTPLLLSPVRRVRSLSDGDLAESEHFATIAPLDPDAARPVTMA